MARKGRQAMLEGHCYFNQLAEPKGHQQPNLHGPGRPFPENKPNERELDCVTEHLWSLAM